MTTLAGAVREIEDDQVEEVCRQLRLGPELAEIVQARHRRDRSLLGVYHALGGDHRDYVRSMAEVARGLLGRG